ncbi:MAG: LCP family protein [Candidatus Margulisiibacteriota bacterium]|nr:LCP family protein [Candidatus Margulisiibacteriota bacterium]
MKKRRSKIDFARVLAFFVVLIAIVYFYINIFSPTSVPKAFRIGLLRKPVNILVLGTDITYDRKTLKPMPDRKGRADTILLAHIDPAKEKISVLSVPRDTLVDIPSYGKQKINFANAWGGLELTKQIITEITGKKIDYFVEVKPTAVTKLIDVLGGVTLYVDVNMRYRDRAQGLNIDLKKGWQKLSGKQAHDYIRYRDNFRGDIVRIEHQQNFIKAVAKEIIKPSKIFRAPQALYTAMQEIKTDLPASKIIRLLNMSRMLSIDDIYTVMIPGDVTMEAGVGSVWVPDQVAFEKELNQYF